jgi:hypothetical protein
MYQDTITLFNRKPGERGQPDTWYPTVIHNVNLNIDRAAIIAKYGASSQDNAVLHIQYQQKNGEITIVCDSETEKQWMPPKSWDKTVDSITFASGTNFDFFWQGQWNGGIVSDEDYAGGFYDHMNHTYDYVFAISSVAMYSVIPHFEIMGK